MNSKHTRVLASLFFLLVPFQVIQAASMESELSLWYDEPAAEWVEALPVGNGRLGAMVFGGVAQARYQFNEDSLWAGSPHDYAHAGAHKVLPELRRLLFAGKQNEAHALAMQDFMSQPLRQIAYQPFGDLELSFPNHASCTDYRRSLDLNTGIATTRYCIQGVTYTREVFASFPDQVIVVRLSCDRPGRLTFSARLTSPHDEAIAETLNASTLALRGRPNDFKSNRLPAPIPSKLRFEARVHVTYAGGSVSAKGDAVHVKEAHSATLILAGATSFKSYKDISADPGARCKTVLVTATNKAYQHLQQSHLKDHQALFQRVSLDLGRTDAAQHPTDQRIEDFAAGHDPALAALFFQYGRYLLIASSRAGGQPANLQGLWNAELAPPWDSKYTVNINTEMNYWPAEITNLPECHEPLFAALAELAESGRRTARTHYNARGWVLHHNFDLWRGTAPINHANHGIWVTGGAWLCQHLWWHYEYSGDRQFLAERAYPLMKGAAEFFVDYLVEDPRDKHGWLLSGPSNSPENGGLVMGPTMDHQIIRNLLANTIAAADVLGIDRAFAKKLKAIRTRIAPNLIGQHGQLQEWLEDKDNPRNTHRHVSHLWGLHPGDEITVETPALFAAAKQSLLFRGDGGTGWSRAWKINFWARLLDGDHAYLMLKNLLVPSRLPQSTRLQGGVFPNLFDSHPPFQIDGNFGATSGMTEMLLQSHRSAPQGRGVLIDLLPALPAVWPQGKISGLRARGGFEVDISWQQGRLVAAQVLAMHDGPVTIQSGGRRIVLQTKAGQRYRLNADLGIQQ
jgi:alpha-L-fucosidase 2